MRKSFVSVGLAAIAATVAGNATAQTLRPPFEDSTIRFEADYWRPELTAQVRIGEIGTLLDLKDDLGVVDDDTFRVGATIRFSDRSRLHVSYTPLKYSGDKRLERTVIFDGKTYSVNTQVQSSLDGSYFAADYRFGLIRSEGLELDGLVGVKYADVDALVVSVDIGQRALASLKAPVPIVGAVARINTGPVGFSGEFSGLTIGSRGSLYELDIKARAFLGRNLAAHAGYRRLHVRVDHDSDFGIFKPGGFYFGAELGL